MSIHNSFKNRIMAAMGIVILVGTLSVVHLGHSTAQTPRDCPGVSICNTVSDPIPVVHQGGINISNGEMPSIPVKQQGTASVEVSGPIAVDTSLRSPLYVAQAIIPDNIFYAQANIVLPAVGPNLVVVNPTGFDVPVGKTLILKYVSADITTANFVQVPNVVLRTTHPALSTPILFLPYEVRQGAIEWAISQAAGMPAKSGTPIEVAFSRSGGGQASMTIAIMGDLIDSP